MLYVERYCEITIYGGLIYMEHENLMTNLTCGEISSLWVTYEYETLSRCGIHFFLHHVEDDEIKELLEQTLELSNKRLKKLKEFLKRDNHPHPEGFSIDGDVNDDAPRLFSDKLYLYYCLEVYKLELTMYQAAFQEVVEEELQHFFREVINDAMDMEMKAKELSLKKGIFNRDPGLPIPKQKKYVEKENFIAGWIGEKRPLLGIEIAQLTFNAKRNALGQAVITGFAQVAQSKEIRRFFERGRDIAGKHYDEFQDVLEKEYLPVVAALQTAEVTDSKIAPFSDKLMMSFITLLISSGMGAYGAAKSASARRDLGLMYTKLAAEVAGYSNDAAEILIDHGWMEQPPMAANRKKLAK